jgi:hypothetical protein
MKLSSWLTACAAAAALSAPANAHLGYGGRDFGTYLASAEKTLTISVTNIAGLFGWADGTDADWGDSHRLRIFKFALAEPAQIHISVTGQAGFLPGYSLYSGLADPVSPDHDASEISLAYLDTFGGKEGVFTALETWKVGSDLDTTFADMTTFTYIGHAADGTSANFGPAAGISGDGLADGFVTRSFNLPAGNYSFFVGGADYASTTTANQSASITVSNVPEPGTALSLISGLAMLCVKRRRRTGS